ncbi:MAG: anti-sigma factor [Mesorhizobium sp.]|nr:anti-sigma factor [Mesorhizobium sp.]
MGAEFTERDIHLALDGELPAERLREFNVWLDAHPEMKLRAGRFDADRQRLRTALGPVAYEAVPGALTETILGKGSERTGLKPWRRNAVAAGLVLVGLLGGYLIGVSGGVPGQGSDAHASEPVAERAVSAHVIYAAEKLHVVEVGADQKEHLVGWLSKRVGTNLSAPDLTAEGFDLVGGRLLPSGEKVAAQFMYQDRAGNRISLYITSAAGGSETGFRLFERGGARAFYWVDGGFGYAVAGAVAGPVVEAVARSAYRQLLNAPARG